MKMKIVALAAIALTACQKDKTSEVSKYITINASVSEQTAAEAKATTHATSTAFEMGDQISVYSWTGSNTAVQTPLVVDNSINTYDDTKWSASPQMLWKDLTTAHYFLGVYPQKAITNITADAYATPTDVLVAMVLDAGRTASDGIVPMTFDHIMAKLVVNLTFRTQFGGIPTVTSVKTSAKAISTVDYLAKTATATGTAADVTLGATTANTAYATSLAPQDVTTIVITIDGKDYTYTHPSNLALLSGKIQTVNLIVGRDEITLGSVAINDWTTGEEITGGEALN